MQTQSKIAAFVRWILTWPVLVIMALNIENATSEAGYATIINQHWKDTFPMLKVIYGYATSSWVLYPALIFFGASLYEWIAFTSNRMEADGSRHQKWLITSNADNMAAAFFRKGLARASIRPERDLVKMNNRLEKFNLPKIPLSFENDQNINNIFGSYLTIISKGQFDHARQFIEQSNLERDGEHQ